jgi:peptidoglycan/xylan/chitin deacetylase (PgdA/CDA1 family)
MKDIPIIVCIDVEPDERQLDGKSRKDWDGFERTLECFEGFRAKLERATNAPVMFSWFLRMDEQIEQTYGNHLWVVERYGRNIQDLQVAGDELGLHTHAWRWNESGRMWISEFADQSWIGRCLDQTSKAFEQAFGRRCVSFRFGDRWMNNETMTHLESLGVKFDLTVEPGIKRTRAESKVAVGSFPDYASALTYPYKPSRKDFRKTTRTDRDMWVIPITTGPVPGRFPTLKRILRTNGIEAMTRRCTLALNPGLSERNFRAVVNNSLAREGPSYLAIVIRTDACLHSRIRTTVLRNMDFILSHPLVTSFRFVSPAEAIGLLHGNQAVAKLRPGVAFSQADRMAGAR